jgi:aspartyl/asparaginyl-tRNA synthetase
MDFSALPQELCDIIWAKILRMERERIKKYFVKKVLRQLKREHEKDDEVFFTGRRSAKDLKIKKFSRLSFTDMMEMLDRMEISNALIPNDDDFNSIEIVDIR